MHHASHKYFYIILSIVTFLMTPSLYAAGDDDNILGISNARLRKGDVHIDDIPNAIRSMIDFLMGIAGTIAVIMIVIGSYKILYGGLKSDRTE